MGFSGSVVGKAGNGIPPRFLLPILLLFYSNSSSSGLYLVEISTRVSHVNDFSLISSSETRFSFFLDYVGHFN